MYAGAGQMPDLCLTLLAALYLKGLDRVDLEGKPLQGLHAAP